MSNKDFLAAMVALDEAKASLAREEESFSKEYGKSVLDSLKDLPDGRQITFYIVGECFGDGGIIKQTGVLVTDAAGRHIAGQCGFYNIERDAAFIKLFIDKETAVSWVNFKAAELLDSIARRKASNAKQQQGNETRKKNVEAALAKALEVLA